MTSSPGMEIAVIGMAGRFPGARNLEEFWSNLKNGVESICFFTDEELEEAGISPVYLKNPDYIKAFGALEDIDAFDAGFFRYTPAEAEVMDPQIRIFHEIAWEALEDSGYNPYYYDGLIALIGGASSNLEWEALAILSGKYTRGFFSAFQFKEIDFLSLRVAYKLNLKGPALTVQTGCSTSLVSIHVACQGLLNGEYDIALAGGVSIGPCQKRGYIYREGMVMSSNGHCRAYDADANGTVGGNGAAIVVLKILEEALKDGDHIYAVIKGSAINNDGMGKAGFTAPSVEGQAEVIKVAHEVAGVTPESISYIEGHGTGTNLGDPVEAKALTLAFNTDKRHFCALGSVKTNFGHLDAAAGVTGFIKTVLALHHRLIPPSLHFKNPNPKIDFENSPFYVNTKLTELKNEKYPLRAGVSSFGIGGTNAHVVLEEWRMAQSAVRKAESAMGQGRRGVPPPGQSRDYQLIVLSARTETALERATQNVVNYFKRNDRINLADAAYTLLVGRKALPYRRMMVGSDVESVIDQLSVLGSRNLRKFYSKEEKKTIIFMFPGLGSQYVNMGLELYKKEPLLREEMDHCFNILNTMMDDDIKEILYPQNSHHSSFINTPNHFEVAQVVIFIFEYALAKLLMKWGITPDAMIGYSFGEYTAACLSGVFSLEDALKLIVTRGQLITQVPAGSMLSVPLAVDELKSLLNKELSLAIDNGPSCIVAGSKEAIAAFERKMKEGKVLCMRLQTSHAIHSEMMEPILMEFEKHSNQVKLSKPQIPYISNVTGKWITVQDAADPTYWSRHMRETVQFAKGINELIKEPNTIFIEIGPGRDLCTLFVRHKEVNLEHRAINLVRPMQQDIPDDRYLLSKIGQLWLYGINIDWREFYSGEKRHRIPLPTYSFDRQRYWFNGNPFKIAARMLSQTFPASEKTGMASWFYIPSWKPSVFPIGGFGKIPDNSCWLMFIDESNLSLQLVEQLKQEGEEVVCVRIGDEFKKVNGFVYTINPKRGDDYNILLGNLCPSGNIPPRIVHLWNITGTVNNQLEFEQVQLAQETGFYSLLYLARAIGRQNYTVNNKIQIKVVTNNMQKVPGEDIIYPEKATVLAAVKFIPQGYPYIDCCSIDIAVPRPGSWQEKKLRKQLLVELKQESSHPEIVYRGNERLVRAYEPVTLAKADDAQIKLRKGGVYLITNGLEGIGFKMAEYLAQKLHPKLLLIESSTFPQRNDWEQWLPTGVEDQSIIKMDLKQELPFLTETEEKIEKEMTIKGIEHYEGLEETINELCSSYILDYFRANFLDTGTGKIYRIEDLKKRLKILPKFNKFFDFFVDVLSEDEIIKVEENRLEFIEGVTKVKKSTVLLNEAVKRYPGFKGTLKLIGYCANNYKEALSGDTDAISVLFPEGHNIRFKDEYIDPAEHSYVHLYIFLLQELISKILKELKYKRKFKILEIGAGNGILTRVITSRLKDQNVEYHFTDIGNYFVINAKKEAKKLGFTFMEFGTFDISTEPTAQGYENHSFDMILGFNVVHATRNIRESTGNLKQLLVPGGMMCLIEATNPGRWLNMVDGLAEGWWYFEDEDIRQNSPLLNLDDWEKVLREQGFQKVISFPQDKDRRSKRNCGLIICQQPGDIVPDSKFTKKCQDERQKTRSKIEKLKQLEARGAEVQVITADVANQEQMQKVISQAEERFEKINGVIHNAEKNDNENNIQEWSYEQTARILGPKVKSALVLETIFKDVHLDFFLICSSLHSIIYTTGTIGNYAANTFFNYFSHYKSSRHGSFIVSINWDSHGPLAIDASLPTSTVDNILGRIMQHSFPQVIVSTRDLANLIEQPGKPVKNETFIQEPLVEIKASDSKYQRLELSSKYAAPENKIEKILADTWTEFLGIEKIGINDDFFELGADSLIFITIAAKIHKTLSVKIPLPVFFRKPTIKELALYINEGQKDVYSSIKPVEKKEYYALSSEQRRLYILQQIEAEKKAYNEVFVLRLEGEFDKNRMEETFKKLIQRHESLRTSFHMVEDEPVQKIHDVVEFKVQWLTDSGRKLAAFDREHMGEYGVSVLEVESIIHDFETPFDLSEPPLLRVGFIKESETSHILVSLMHHIITDGTSNVLFSNEFIELYAQKVLPLLKLHYKDFSEWQQSREVKEALKHQEEYWLKQFDEEIPILKIPTDFSRPAVQSFEGNAIDFSLNIEETKALNEIALLEEATLFMVLLALFNIFLSKLSSQEDIIVGSLIAGRNHSDLERTIGMFVSTLALRNYPSGERTFKQLLSQVKERSLKAFENQNYPFEELVSKVEVKRDVRRNPLFDVMFALQNYFVVSEEISEQEKEILKIKPCPIEHKKSKFDLSLYAYEGKEKLALKFEYCIKLFKDETIEKFIQYFKKIVSSVIENHEKKISEIEIIPGEEKRQLLYDFNDTAAEYPRDKTIHELFEAQVEKTPDHISVIGPSVDVMHLQTLANPDALVSHANKFSYRELSEKSNQLADLLHSMGSKWDIIVGIMMERSVEMIIGIFGILKAGGAYLPIAPDYPPERIHFMLADSGTNILLTTPDLSEKFEKLSIVNCQLLMVNEKPPGCRRLHIPPQDASSHLHLPPAPTTSLAYIIYTSGSTGRPKGVMIEHRSVVNRINWMQREYPIEAEDVILQKTPFTFDVSVWELFWWCFRGASLRLLGPGKEKDPEAIVKAIAESHITVMHFVPSMLQAFLEYLGASKTRYLKALTRLNRVFASGEALTVHQVERFNALLYQANNTKLANLYGPTEATVDVSYFNCLPGERLTKVPIGKPIDNINLYVVDRKMTLQPIGVMGELCISGDGVSRGYLNKPELTNYKFIIINDKLKIKNGNENHEGHEGYETIIGRHRGLPLPLTRNTNTIYRTGDLARWLPDGNIEFLGRIDHQVKIRGFRIELGEIEIQLLKHQDIDEAVVSDRTNENGDKYLAAYIVSEAALDTTKLRNTLSASLPDYMIPSYFVPLEAIPLTANGKVDSKALPSPEGISLQENVGYVPPGNALEKKLVEIWEKVLNRNNIGVNENFFLIGGDSIKSIQITSRLSSAGLKLEMRDLFQYPSIADLAPHVKKVERIPDQSAVTGEIQLTPIQAKFFDDSLIESHYYNHAVMLYSKDGFDEEAIAAVFKKLQEHHDVLRMIYKRKDGNILQINQGPDYPLSMQTYDLKKREDGVNILENKANEIQAGIDLENGPMMKLGLFHLDDGDRLLIVIHHLVIDGVSWRILFEDIETLYRQYENGEKFSLPLKSDSFKLWAAELSEYANSQLFLREKDYWEKLESMTIPEIEKDFDERTNYINYVETVSFELSEEETNLLLTKVNRPLGTEINDILLSALGLGIKKTFGHNRVLITLEGHGREKILEDPDISRTVGWFTSIYPVVLDVSRAADTGRQIKEIKETLRRVPNRGIGHGILKYITAEEYKNEIDFKLNPQISFNYLGQFDADVKQTFFGIAKESTGHSQSPKNQRKYEIDVSGMIANDRLAMGLTYNKSQFKPETMEAFMENFQAELEHLIAFCSAKEEIELTPSDFTYKGLTIENIDGLMRRYPSMEDIYQLTPMQEGMLFHALYDKSSQAYFEQFSYRLHGELDISIAEKSIAEISKRHDILRIAIAHQQVERAVQVVLKDREIDFSYEDIRELAGAEEKQLFIKKFKETDRSRTFDLSKDPLMRIVILRLAEQEYELIWSFHHILMDGWCVGILNSEFFEFYNSYLEDRPSRFPGIKSYRTYIEWRNKLDENAMADYWRDYLAGFEEQTALPQKSSQKDTGNDYENGQFSFSLNSAKTKKLATAAAKNHATMSTIVRTLWGILLGKYNAKEDVVFGAVISGRPPEIVAVESMVGIFINTIPVRIRFEGKTKFNRLLRRAQAEAIDSEPHHYYSLAEIQSQSLLKQGLIDNILIFENFPLADEIKGYENRTGWELELSDIEFFEQTNYNFNLMATNGEELNMRFNYNKNMFDDVFVESIARHFLRIIDQTIGNEEITIDRLTLLSDREMQQILYQFNDTATEYPKDKTFHQIFEEQVERSSEQLAVISGGVQITYGDLNQGANRLAHVLQEKGVGPDTIVALKVERSIEMIIGIMGILKSGGAYLPLDPIYPSERIKYILEDSNATLLLTEKEISSAFRSPVTGRVSEALPGTGASGLAYTIYTSGSTGRPKGVMIQHRALNNFIKGITGIIPFGPEDTILSLTTISFDIFGLETLLPLTRGSKVIIGTSSEQMNPEAAARAISNKDVTIMQVTPSRLTMLVEHEASAPCLKKLGYLLVGGEAFPEQLLEKTRELGVNKIYNMYGPTETTIWSTVKDVSAGEDLNIGKPIANTGIYILGKGNAPQPIGITGELCIAGDGLARGYVNRPELTAEKFIHLTLNTQQVTLYKTGDLARWLPDGNIECLGRIDHQVKIRGFRIELGEIEAHLLKCPGIHEAVVIDRKNSEGKTFLCAYLVTEKEPDTQELRNILSTYLPDYMIPSYVIRVEKIPLTGSGKIDRKKLEAIGVDMRSSAEYTAPRNEIEQKIAKIWQEVLKLEKVGIHENFFDVGGTSLDIIKLNAAFKEIFDETETVVQMFRYPTIRSFAEYLNQKKYGINDSKQNAYRVIPVNQIKNERAQQKQKRKRR